MPLFSIPLSGLDAASAALDVISNNLANLNTNGYKDQNVSFRDLFYQTRMASGNGNPVQVGRGVQVGAISADFNNGTVSPTGVNTDMALQGPGMFVIELNGVQMYTRDGHFGTNEMGQLSTMNGELVLGYPAVNGAVNTLAGLQPIQLGRNVTNPASPTTSLQLNTNLDASTVVGAPAWTTPIEVYDSLGASHVLTFSFARTAVGNPTATPPTDSSWTYSISIPSSEVIGGTGTSTVLATGNLTFDTNGRMVLPAANISFTSPALVDGAAPLSLSWNVRDALGNAAISQLGSASSTASHYQDGFAAGTLQDFAVDELGNIAGTFSNNQVVILGQIAIANFSNYQGLQREGGNNFRATTASGNPALGTAGSGGRGTIAGGSLELSNVDVATEFSKMIIAQRGYEANAKVVTTFDEVTQTTINMKR